MVKAYCRGDRQVLDGGPGKDRIGTWDTSRIQDFSRVFGPDEGDALDCVHFNESLDGWNMSSATNMKVSRVPLSIY